MIAYTADWVCPGTSAPLRDGALVVDNGQIVSVGAGDDSAGVERKPFPGCVIIPGFVNAHAHLELTIFRGILKNLSFTDWIAELVRIKYQTCTRDALRLSARLGAIEMLQAGVTAVGEVMDVGTGFEAMLEFGLRGVAYQEVFGPAEDACDGALRVLEEKVDRQRKLETPSQRIGVSPHAPYTVSQRLYEAVRDYARQERLRMTAHIAESQDETRFVRDGAGPFAAAHARRGIPVIARECLPVAYLDRLGLLGPDMLLTHAIETNAADIARIRETGSFVVHCPKSNAYLGHGVAPVAELRAREVAVCLGTDSPASNDAIDMFAEMRAVLEQQRLPVEDVFRMATIEGARALGLEQHVGSLEPGKAADFAVVKVEQGGDPVEEMIRFGSAADVQATFVGGRRISVDDRELRAEIKRIALG